MVHPKTLKIRERIIDFSKPKVMGIVNLTPDSFYPDSRVIHTASVIQMVNQMISEGVDMVDLGAASTRPGSHPPTARTEIERLVPALTAIRRHFPDLIVSIDTYRSEVLSEAAKIGIDLVNDISAGQMDASFLKTVAKLNIPYVLMHMKGTPADMQNDAHYDDLVLELLRFFSNRLNILAEMGIEDVLLDPGIGFGKRISHNFKILRELETLRLFDRPLLVGLSRKSFIYKTLHTTTEKALNGTSAMHMLALKAGADVLRVHDVAPAVECVRLWNEYCQ